MLMICKQHSCPERNYEAGLFTPHMSLGDFTKRRVDVGLVFLKPSKYRRYFVDSLNRLLMSGANSGLGSWLCECFGLWAIPPTIHII